MITGEVAQPISLYIPDNADGTKWDWNKRLPIDIYSNHLLAGCPGWDKSESDPRLPPYISTRLIIGQGKSPHQIAVWWDDISKGQFWCETIPDNLGSFLCNGDSCTLWLYFQLKSDRDDFNDLLPGFLGRQFL